MEENICLFNATFLVFPCGKLLSKNNYFPIHKLWNNWGNICTGIKRHYNVFTALGTRRTGGHKSKSAECHRRKSVFKSWCFHKKCKFQINWPIFLLLLLFIILWIINVLFLFHFLFKNVWIFWLFLQLSPKIRLVIKSVDQSDWWFQSQIIKCLFYRFFPEIV